MVQIASSADTETQHNKSFRTHAEYVRAFRTLALGPTCRGGVAEQLSNLHKRIYKSLNPRENNEADVATALACLRRAWGTELIFESTSKFGSEVMRLANSWGTVQAYYILYGATQSVLVSEGKTRPTSHEPTQKQYVDLWPNRPTIAVPPWSLAAGHPAMKVGNSDGMIGGPDRELNLKLHPWSDWQEYQSWDICAQALISTRNKRIEEALTRKRKEKAAQRRKAWKAEEEERRSKGLPVRIAPTGKKSNLTKQEKESITQNARMITIFDYVYRLRIKANYDAADDFWEGPKTDSEAIRFAHDLVLLSSANMLVNEARVAQNVGKSILLDEMDRWLQRNHHKLSRYGAHFRRTLHDNLPL